MLLIHKCKFKKKIKDLKLVLSNNYYPLIIEFILIKQQKN